MRMEGNEWGQVQAEEQTCLCDQVTFPLRSKENGEATLEPERRGLWLRTNDAPLGAGPAED